MKTGSFGKSDKYGLLFLFQRTTTNHQGMISWHDPCQVSVKYLVTPVFGNYPWLRPDDQGKRETYLMNKSIYETHYPLWMVKSCASSWKYSATLNATHLKKLQTTYSFYRRGSTWGTWDLTALFRCFRKFKSNTFPALSGHFSEDLVCSQ